MSDLPSEALRQKRHVGVLANPRAGTRSQRRYVQALLQELRDRELIVTPCWTREALGELLRNEADNLRCIVAAGGDGTLNEVINRAGNIPVAVLPLGNENLVARHFRLNRSASHLAQAIAFGPIRQVDLGKANGRYFSLMAGVGIDAQVIHDVHHARRGHINKWSYALPLMRSLWNYPFPPIEVEIEETKERLCGAAVFVFNLPVYALGIPLGRKARADDGWLDLLVFQTPGLFAMARYLRAVVWREHERLPDVQYRRVKRVRLWSDAPVPVQTDGDPAGMLPVKLEVAPEALKLLLPW